MYLKEIYLLSKCVKKVRITDVANAMGVSKASVNYAVDKLCKKGLVSHKLYGNIEMTEEGIAKGCEMCEKQAIIAKYFTAFLSINKKAADIEASRLHYVISDITIEKMSEWLNKKGDYGK